MAPRNRQKQLSKGRYKQTFRGPVRSSNPSFTALETTPTKDSCKTGQPETAAMFHITTPTTPQGTSGRNPLDGDDFDEEGLEDSDMLALEGSPTVKAPGKTKSFAWSEADSASRRSSPALAGETPQANWELVDVDAIPNPYSSPGSGTGTYPSTMPLQQSHLAALLPETIMLTEPPFDFSETASTARRSTPFEAHSIQDAAWELGESNPVTPRTSRHSPDSPSPHSTNDGRPVQAAKRPEGSHENDDSLGHIATPGNPSSLHEKAGLLRSTKQSQGLRGQASSRRKQRPKTPIYVDESTQRANSESAHLGDEQVLSGAQAAIASRKTSKAVGKHDTLKRKVKGNESSRSRKKVKKPYDEPKDKDLDSSWEPPPTTRNRPAALKGAGHPVTEPMPASSVGPAANTRAGGKGVQKAGQSAIEKQDTQMPVAPVESPLSDPPSTHSSRRISSDDLHFFSPDDLNSTYFLDDSEPRSEAEPGQSASFTKMSASGGETSTRDPLIRNSLVSEPAKETVGQGKLAASTEQSEPTNFAESCALAHTDVAHEPVAAHISTQRPPVRTAAKTQPRKPIELSSDSDFSSSGDDIRSEDVPRQAQVRYPVTHNAQKGRARPTIMSEQEMSPRGVPVSSRSPDGPSMYAKPKEYKLSMANRAQKKPQAPSSKLDRVKVIEGETDFRAMSNLKVSKLPRLDDQAHKKHTSRIVSIGRDGSPILAPVAEHNDTWHGRNAGEVSILDDGPIELKYSGQTSGSSESEDRSSPAGHFSQPARLSFVSSTELKLKKNAEKARAPLAHLSLEAANLMKGVDRRLQGLAKDLHAVDEVYGIKMKRCLSKIIGTGNEERCRIEKVNRQNVRKFQSIADEARQIVEQQVSDREIAMGNMNRAWAQRESVYDGALNGLERLSRALRRAT